MPEQLESVDLPECLTYLWNWFNILTSKRGFNEVGVLPLTFTEINSWAKLFKIELESWELNSLISLDAVYLTETRKK